MNLLSSNEIRTLTATASSILIATVCLSFAARLFWIPDLFSHFLIQYIVGAIILAPLSLLNRQRFQALAICAILIISLCEISMFYSKNVGLSVQVNAPSFTVVQFNKLVSNKNYAAIEEWLINNNALFDLVILQEADPQLTQVAEKVKEYYPNQIIQPKEHAFGTIILGKSSLISVQPYKTDTQFYTNTAHIIQAMPEGFKAPVMVYAVHAVPPVSYKYWTQRNAELRDIATHTESDPHKNIIAMGDWNITPYSPFFRDLIKTSRLHYHFQNIYPEPTWPDKFQFHLFQIPIDHILFSNGLKPVMKRIDPALGSDHHPVIMTFVEQN